MAFSEIVAPTLRQLFTDQVLRMIFSGELRVGQKLPSERELSEKMHISRSMVHIGLEDLSRMGFVRMEPRRGNYIADYSRTGNLETLSAIVKYGGGGGDDELRISLVELRDAIEGGAMIRLAECCTKDDLAALREITADLKRAAAAGEEPARLAEHMRRFDLTITERCGNRLFPIILNSFAGIGASIWETCVRFWGAETVISQEEHITRLLEEGKGHEAARYIENIYRHYSEANHRPKEQTV